MGQELINRFMEETDRRFEGVHSRFDKIDYKLDQVLAFRWQIIGGATSVSALIGIAMHFMTN